MNLDKSILKKAFSTMATAKAMANLYEDNFKIVSKVFSQIKLLYSIDDKSIEFGYNIVFLQIERNGISLPIK